MNIQIFGVKKCFDTKKAQRYFKERRVKFQDIDLKKIGISRGELTSVISAVGLDNLVDPDHPDAALLGYLADNQAKIEHILEDPTLLRTPIVRNGRQATVGYCPDVWESWKLKSLFAFPWGKAKRKPPPGVRRGFWLTSGVR